jgi:hypothetical protein
VTAFLQTLLIVFGIITATLAFVEWIIGEQGVNVVKERLISWYVYIGDGGLTRIIQASAAFAERILTRLLGARLISFRAYTVWSVITVVAVLLPAIEIARNVIGSAVDRALVVPIFSLLSGFAISLCDFPFLVISRLLFRRMSNAQNGLLIAAVYLVYAYFSAGILSIALLESAKHFRGWDVVRLVNWPGLILSVANDKWQAVFIFFYGLSSLLFFFCFFVALIVRIFQRPTRAIAMLVLDRLASSQKGVFTSLAGGFTIIAALITAITGIKGR